MKNRRILARAMHKAQHSGGREWRGCFTPAEILALVADGAKPKPSSEYVVAWAKEKVAEGESNPNWFYFTHQRFVHHREKV
jgi:hypothetical protein